MNVRSSTRTRAGLTALASTVLLLPTPSRAQVAAGEPVSVPADLRPLLTGTQSELRLVTQRYVLDRRQLHGNYAGAHRNSEGLVLVHGPVDPVVPLSAGRLSRLMRFDLSWSDAAAALDRASLTELGRADIEALRALIASNLEEIEADAARMAALSPLLPFAPSLVELIEARIRVEAVDGQEAAAQLTRAAEQVGAAAARISDDPIPSGLARDGAAAVRLLLRDVEEWFEFRYGYDPEFTWWVEMPWVDLRSALVDYGDLLSRLATTERGEPSTVPGSRGSASSAPVVVRPSLPPPVPDVPDLDALIALPQDEMRDVVARFRRGHEAETRPVGFYGDWLTALESLEFSALSRPAQVDYLYIRRTSRLAVEREGVELPSDPPRKQDDSGIVGDARGREGLLRDLADAMIAYTPEELITLAEREFAWVEGELVRAAGELGFEDDWKAAIEHVKGLHPAPGGQPVVIRAMLTEAVDYLREQALLTVPPAAAESMQIVMLTPDQQLINPFFRGGARMSLSYPTPPMDYTWRLQSMRGNNTPFSHATAHHEMIPGHYFSLYMANRYAGYRADLGFESPFFREGWALYWELMLYERGFHDTPEERVGALFWLLHRCARIIFSLQFHMGEWSPQESIDFLVDAVGHERENAIAEIRRSFGGTYAPLYQAAYLLGGLQIRALHRELVESGRMTARAFNDEILRQGSMPIALLRAAISGDELSPATSLDWRFYGDVDRR